LRRRLVNSRIISELPEYLSLLQENRISAAKAQQTEKRPVALSEALAIILPGRQGPLMPGITFILGLAAQVQYGARKWQI
jgi:hypothetical protein